MAYEASTAGVVQQDKTTITTNHTCGATAKMVIATLHTNTIGSGSIPSSISVTFDGVEMTRIGSVVVRNYITVSAYYLKNPPTGSSKACTASWTNSQRRCQLNILSYTDTDIRANSVTANGNSTSVSQNITTVSGDTSIDAATVYGNGKSYTAGANQTIRVGADTLQTTTGVTDETSTGTSTTMSDSWIGSDDYVFIAFSLYISPTGGQVIIWTSD